MLAWRSMGFRLLVLAVMSFLPAAILWPIGSATGQPLFQGSLACPAGVPTASQVGNGLLSAVGDPLNGDPLNTAWENAALVIPGQTIILNRVHVPDGCSMGGSDFCTSKAAGCSFVYVDMQVEQLVGLGPLRFTNLKISQTTDVSQNTQVDLVNQRNVAAHTNRGPDASVITDGVFGPEGSDSTNTAYAIVLPHNGANGAIVIDLSSIVDICGVASGCTAPTIQADNDDIYQLDYSTDGKTWTRFAPFPTTGGSGLHTRSLSASTLGSSFSARYVRVYATSGGATFAVSELQLWDTGNHLVSVGKPAVGPLPNQIVDGDPAPAGHSSTDTSYSVVLVHKTGSATALMVDLGQVVQICGNKFTCVHEPTIQADNDDTYMLDYSINGKDWTTYGFMDRDGTWHGTFPPFGGSGLQTRDMQCTARPDPNSACAVTNEGPNVFARYVRVYARSGGNTFAVSELYLWDTVGNPILPVSSAPLPYSPQAYGPEPFFTNGEFAPEGTAWDDATYATKLGSCTANAHSHCPVAASGTATPMSAAKQIDLIAVFPISQITIQADSNDTYQVDGSLDGVTWTALWTVPTGSGGLRSRTSPTVPTLPSARYVRVYATAGDGDYSVSELQVFTPQANTAGTYATSEDNQGFLWSHGANDPVVTNGEVAQNFVCSYDAPFTTALAVDQGTTPPTVKPFSQLPIQFFVDYVSLNAHCTDGNDYNIAAAHNRQCNLTLVPTTLYSPPFTDQFQAGFCAPPSPGSNGYAVLSYLHFDDNPDTNENNSAIQFDSLDDVSPTPGVSDLQCTDFGSLDAHIPDVLRGFIPIIAAGATKSVLNQVLDYPYNPLNNQGMVIPFPRITTSGPPFPPLTCPPATVAESPTPAADNISGLAGRATHVGGGSSATLRIVGRFTAETPILLDEATLAVHSLLQESGVGDAVRGPDGEPLIPLGLQPLNGSHADKGLYRTEPAASPKVSARIEPTKGARNGSMDFEIDVQRATILKPDRCLKGSPTAPLTTSFLLVGGSETPVWVHATVSWQCNPGDLRTP
jgi:hypothetical protein